MATAASIATMTTTILNSIKVNPDWRNGRRPERFTRCNVISLRFIVMMVLNKTSRWNSVCCARIALQNRGSPIEATIKSSQDHCRAVATQVLTFETLWAPEKNADSSYLHTPFHYTENSLLWLFAWWQMSHFPTYCSRKEREQFHILRGGYALARNDQFNQVSPRIQRSAWLLLSTRAPYQSNAVKQFQNDHDSIYINVIKSNISMKSISFWRDDCRVKFS